jgi:hypothetical protein
VASAQGFISRKDGRAARITTGAAVVLIAAGVFWRTAYPTITWWDSARYSVTAATFGVTSSPGSLLLTLIGWVATRAADGLTSARVLSLTGAAIATATIGFVYVAGLRIRRLADSRVCTINLTSRIGAALGALAFAFSTTLWEYATQFTPYILSAAFTALIFIAMLRWWRVAEEPSAWRVLALLTFLFGLDFSVHRTNAMLLPGAIAWVLIRQPRTVRRPKAWLAASGGLVAGLSMQLFVMPISRSTHSPINMAEPNTWSRFWDYVSLAQVGGGFLINVWPRNAPWWSFQVADFCHALGDNFFTVNGPLGPLGAVPGLAAVFALVALWRRSRRLGVALAAVVLLHAITTVAYFNIPANYFRSLYRHYLPVFVDVAIVATCGFSLVADRVAAVVRGPRRHLALGMTALGALLALLAPVAQVTRNWGASDASRRHFAHDFAMNALDPLPPNAILFTVGDNDTFPLWYVQAVEHVRPDVIVVNLSLANADWYVRQLARRYPSFPVRDIPPARRDSADVTIPGASPETVGLPPGTAALDSLRVRPVSRYGSAMTAADWVLLDIVRNNAWRRPITVSTTAGEDGLGWLKPYARLEGLFWRIVPVGHPRSDAELIRTNLRTGYELRGFADPRVKIDDGTRAIGGVYLYALESVLDADRANGDAARCIAELKAVTANVPPERLGYSAADRDEIQHRCQPR